MIDYTLDLFVSSKTSDEEDLKISLQTQPLAHRMRPQKLAEVFGQEHLISHGAPLYNWIEMDRIPPLLLWGPPGCGKTTLARIIASQTAASYQSLSAVEAGTKDIKQVVLHAQEIFRRSRRKTVLFVDEIHRFNRAQQDALLPHVEDGTLILIGATTENPSFELSKALLSRMQVLTLKRLEIEALEKTLAHALADSERGLGGQLLFKPEALNYLAQLSNGDARRGLGLLESISLHSTSEKLGCQMSVDDVRAILHSMGSDSLPIPYDQAGDEHYNVISAFIKSIRDSDPHGSIYYLARMLEGGEDPLFIARRLVILASEDIGNADPGAIRVALSVKDAVDFVGMPEARISLAQAVTYLALAPKSNASYEAIEAALLEVRKSGSLPVPNHLRNGVTGFMKSNGYGKSYQYAHDSPDARVSKTHLPDRLVKTRYYFPRESGREIQMKQKLDFLNLNFEKK